MKKFLAIALAAVMLFAFAACGSKTKTDATNTDAAAMVKLIDINLSDEQYGFGVAKENEELLGQINAFLAKIKDDGTFDAIWNKYFGDGTPEGVVSAEYDESKDQLVVATEVGFYPFEYVEGDLYYGVDMEIAALFAKELGKELVIKSMLFDAVLTDVQLGKSDIAMAALTISEERKDVVSFSDSYISATQKIIVKADDTRFDACKTAEDVVAELDKLPAGTKIGAQGGTTGQLYIEGSEDLGFKGIANAECKAYDNPTLAVTDLVNGNIELVIVDAAPAQALVENFNELA